MNLEEEFLRLLRQYRRLLFRRFRLVFEGDLDGALALEGTISRIEADVRSLADRLAARSFDARSEAVSRLVNQCVTLIDRTIPPLEDLRKRAAVGLFREKADLEIKNFLQKMLRDEP